MPRRPLTELEGCVLGVLSTLGPCTAYVVRCHFLESPSPYWSGSAGSIYPLLKRLRGLGLVQERPREEGRRRSILLSLTAAGRTALAGWLLPPLPE
ncbi:MAG TPA: helix-turn-helix transcriptional regulator, partial [Candidatus Polarisedimenticolia bacterium]|nr:helix-turn-helix transcriptional regulator [Candidatus Polarisedimenticolia bacterium]